MTDTATTTLVPTRDLEAADRRLREARRSYQEASAALERARTELLAADRARHLLEPESDPRAR